ncbi:hypothetical protein ACVWZK_003081 [Bradyrhizobium sp. GM0.4]
MKRPETVPGIPEGQAERIRLVGVTTFDEHGWRVKVAAGIECSRAKLYRLLGGERSRDASAVALDADLLRLMAAERLESERRVRRLRKLERQLAAHIAYVHAAKEANRREA